MENPLILVVDDDPPILKAIRFVLEQVGFSVATAADGGEALRRLADETKPSLIISDIKMPGMDGFELCRVVRNRPGDELMPFIFLTAENSLASRVTGLCIGANAYLGKPFEPAELVALTRTTLDRHLAYQEQVMRDPLTGLLNRRALGRELAAEFNRARRYRRPLSAAMIDIDGFKKFNDAYGHLCGDQVLAGISGIMASHLREQDVLGRFGGEEFLALLPESGLSQALVILERLRGLVEEANWVFGAARVRVTVSIGAAEMREEDGTPEDLVRRADEELYRAKAAGRNRVSPSP